MAILQQELIVRGEQVERVFINYQDKKYVVNRQYQRKLIWTIEEKQSFIDSIIKGFPIPIILLAEPLGRNDGTLEIIDGMQRMNAVMSFITNDFSFDGCYFDLNTFATTKDLLDRGVLEQKKPVLDRTKCLAIASYPVPLSIYEAAERESVEEVFRRINSGGRQLSRQELRAAGATNAFADCVRKISARVRGDTSNTDLLLLSGLAPIFPYTFYHLTHYWFAAADIPVANDTPVHCADAIRCNVRRPPQGSLPLLTRRVSA